jgi:hypothetical protein
VRLEGLCKFKISPHQVSAPGVPEFCSNIHTHTHFYRYRCHRKIFAEIDFQLCNAVMARAFQSVRMKKKRLRRQKKSDPASDRSIEDGERHNHGSPISTQSFRAYTFLDSVHNMMATESSLGTSLHPVWLKTSDSDFSDTEAGHTAKSRVAQGRVRKSALSLLITVTKVTVWLQIC